MGVRSVREQPSVGFEQAVPTPAAPFAVGVLSLDIVSFVDPEYSLNEVAARFLKAFFGERHPIAGHTKAAIGVVEFFGRYVASGSALKLASDEGFNRLAAPNKVIDALLLLGG